MKKYKVKHRNSFYAEYRGLCPMTGISPLSFAPEIRDRTGLSERDIKNVIKALFELISKKLLEREPIRLLGIGMLYTHMRKQHVRQFPMLKMEAITPKRTHMKISMFPKFTQELRKDEEAAYVRHYGSTEKDYRDD